MNHLGLITAFGSGIALGGCFATSGPAQMQAMRAHPKVYELTFNGAADGKTYPGFDAPPGYPQDREIVSFSENLVEMRLVDPDINNRYGTYVYVRWAQRA